MSTSANISAPSAASAPTAHYDVLVVGGGINGCGIARDAVGRGLRVLLVEQHDLAQHTSSSSTKLIHGGLRYLEYYEFSLVRKALQEREVLLRNAPHIISPLRFVMPHAKDQRPAWMIRCGLFLYDHLAKREILPGSQSIRLDQHATGKPLQGSYKYGFVYSDGWVDDARLVALNALDAQERGARILTRTRCVAARRVQGQWQAELLLEDGSSEQVSATAIVNAAGPWAAQFAGIASDPGQTPSYGLRLIKGSHIVVPRMFAHDYAYIFQNPDKRIIFAIPYEEDYTLIGTTDLEYVGDPGKVAIDEDEIAYLCEMASRYFQKKITRQDIVWTYSGVRPLLDDNTENASAVTRDYLLEIKHSAGSAPLLNVWGGKITTYRKLSEEALALLLPHLKNANAQSWTHAAPLPGGDLQEAGTLVQSYDFAAFFAQFTQRYSFLPAHLARRLARSYGTRAEKFLAGARSLQDLGAQLVPNLYEAEARYLLQVEWAKSAEDILWRRSKLGLRCTAEEVAHLRAWISQQRTSQPSPAHNKEVA